CRHGSDWCGAWAAVGGDRGSAITSFRTGIYLAGSAGAGCVYRSVVRARHESAPGHASRGPIKEEFSASILDLCDRCLFVSTRVRGLPVARLSLSEEFFDQTRSRAVALRGSDGIERIDGSYFRTAL